MKRKIEVRPKRLSGTVINKSETTLIVLGSDFYVYSIKDACKKQFDAYKSEVNPGSLISFFFVPYDKRVIQAFPFEFNNEIPDFVEIEI